MTEQVELDEKDKFILSAIASHVAVGTMEESFLRNSAEVMFKRCHPTDFDLPEVQAEFENFYRDLVEEGQKNPYTAHDLLPFGFSIITSGADAGLHYTDHTKEANDPLAKICIGPPLYVLGLVRDENSTNWALLVEFTDPDDKAHRLSLPFELLAGKDAAVWRAMLAKNGWRARGGKKRRELLSLYLESYQPMRRLLGVSRTGWHDNCFVLPHIIIPDSAEIILHAMPSRNPYTQSGTLDGWQKTIGKRCVGNSRLLFAVCAAFAGPLLFLLNQESGGCNLYGGSSMGKSTVAFAAASVWGKGALSDGYVQTWRTTDNALENTAVLHSDTFLCLDEISQVDERVLGAMAYMLSGGQGKGRLKRDSSDAPLKTWRVMLLSTGEQTVADKLMEGGKTPRAGQAVRLLDIPADAGDGLGCFEYLHNDTSAQAFADAVKHAAVTHYGHAGPMFIEMLVQHADTVKGYAKVLTAFAEKLSGNSADGQVQRAATRFSLCAIAGLLAVKFGILPVPEQEVVDAAQKCFDAWLSIRGGKGALEELQLIERVEQFLETHGASRFENLDFSPVPGAAVCHNRAGFKSAKSGSMDYYLNDVTFKKEICRGMDMARAAQVLVDAGYLVKDGQHLKCKLPKNHPEAGRKRHYKLRIPGTAPVTQVPVPPPGWAAPLQNGPIAPLMPLKPSMQ